MKTHTGRQLLWVGRVRMFWNWWLTELSAMVPSGWRQQLTTRVRQLSYTGDAFELVQAGKPVRIAADQLAASDILKAWQGQRRERSPLLVTLPPDQLLHRVIQLPAATEPKLASVLGFELDRHTPFSADQASYSYRVVRRDRTLQRIDVELFVLPNRRREQLLQALSQAGLAPDWVLPQGQESAVPLRSQLNLLPDELRPHKRMRNRWPLLLAFALAVVPLLLFYLQQQHLQSLQAAVEPLRQEAEAAQAIRDEAAALEQGWRFLYQRRMAQPSILLLLDELTLQIPDNTWINRLELEGGELQLQGESSSASDLISRLEGSVLLQDVSFTSPVTINPRSGKERFSIRAQVTREVLP